MKEAGAHRDGPGVVPAEPIDWNPELISRIRPMPLSRDPHHLQSGHSRSLCGKTACLHSVLIRDNGELSPTIVGWVKPESGFADFGFFTAVSESGMDKVSDGKLVGMMSDQ